METHVFNEQTKRGILTGKHINRTKCIKQGILSKEDAAPKYDIVAALLNDGWTFEQPSA